MKRLLLFFHVFRTYFLSYPFHYIGLCLLAASLPLSPYTTGASQFLIMGYWLLEGKFVHKWKVLKSNKPMWAIVFIFLLHVLWLFNTSDFSYAFHDLKIKLPLLILPVILGSYPVLSEVWIKRVIFSLMAGLWAASLLGLCVLLNITPVELIDIRQISLFISHIRLALLLIVAVFSAFYFLFFRGEYITIKEKYLFGISILWFVVFLFLLKSLTGIILLMLIIILTVIWLAFRNKKAWLRILLLVFSVGLPAFFGIYLYVCIQKFYTLDPPESKPDLYSRNGELYYQWDLKMYENGHLVGAYICNRELKSNWEKRSRFKFDSLDKAGQPLNFTLIRYMASLNLRKDAQGMEALKDEDIKMIEDGKTNYIFKNKFSIYPYIYQAIWQFDWFLKGNAPVSHSLTQRIEYTKTAINIIKQNFWFGVGTGDVKLAFDKQYELDQSRLPVHWRLRAHNQYLTLFLTFGVFGFALFIAVLFYPLFYARRFKDYLFVMMFVTAFLSMLNEDTLETQAGVTFFALFIVLFLCRELHKKEPIS